MKTALIILFLYTITSAYGSTTLENKLKDELIDPLQEENSKPQELEPKEHDKRTIFSPEIWARHVGYHHGGSKYVLGYSPVSYKHTPYIKPLRLRPVKMQFHGWKPISTKPHFKPVVPMVRPVIAFKPSAPDVYKPLPVNVPPLGGGLKPWQQQGWGVYGVPEIPKPKPEIKPVLPETTITKPVLLPTPVIPVKPVNAAVPIVPVPVKPIVPSVTHLQPVPLKPIYPAGIYNTGVLKYPFHPLHLQPIQPSTPLVPVPAPAPLLPSGIPPHILHTQQAIVPNPGHIYPGVQVQVLPKTPLAFPGSLLPTAHDIPAHFHPHQAAVPVVPPPAHVPIDHHNVYPGPIPSNILPGHYHPQPGLPVPVVPAPAPPAPLVPNPIAPHAGVLPHPHGGTVEFHGKTAHLIPFRGIAPVVPSVQTVLPAPAVVKTPFAHPNFAFPGPQVFQPSAPDGINNLIPQGVLPAKVPTFTVYPEGHHHHDINGVFSSAKPGVTFVFPQGQPGPSPVLPPQVPPHVPAGGINFDEQFHPHIHTNVVPNPQDQLVPDHHDVPVHAGMVLPHAVPGENSLQHAFGSFNEHQFHSHHQQLVNNNINNVGGGGVIIQPGSTDLHIPQHLPQHPNFRLHTFQQPHEVDFHSNLGNSFHDNLHGFTQHQNDQEQYYNHEHEYQDQLTQPQTNVYHSTFGKREDTNTEDDNTKNNSYENSNSSTKNFKPSPELHTIREGTMK